MAKSSGGSSGGGSLANRAYMAQRKMTSAFYSKDQRAFSAAQSEFAKLTSGLSKKTDF